MLHDRRIGVGLRPAATQSEPWPPERVVIEVSDLVDGGIMILITSCSQGRRTDIKGTWEVGLVLNQDNVG